MNGYSLNRYKIDLWKQDSWASVDYYNNWFMSSAPCAYQTARKGILKKVKEIFATFNYLRDICPQNIIDVPDSLSTLRLCMAPPLAVDRLAGLSYTNRSFITRMEEGKLPQRVKRDELNGNLSRICNILNKLLDRYLFPWIDKNCEPSQQNINRTAAVIADRLTGALADPIIRNTQEQRQLFAIRDYLMGRGYSFIPSSEIKSIYEMPDRTFSFHVNCPINIGQKKIKMPIDVMIQPQKALQPNPLPVLVECKSAGDFTNTNKRRKEEAIKIQQLRQTYGEDIRFILFLCGYFDTSYLGYEASEGLDWVWEHRISDFNLLGV